MGIVVSLRWDRSIHQIEVEHYWGGREYKGGSNRALGKADSGVKDKIYVMRRVPLGSEARLDLYSSLWGETCGRGPFIGIDCVKAVGEARMIMAMQLTLGKDLLGKGIGLWF